MADFNFSKTKDRHHTDMAVAVMNWFGREWDKRKFGQYVLKFERPVRRRSSDQNSRYWAILNCIALETGEDANSLHILFKDMFLKRPDIKVLGRDVAEVPTTTNLTTEQFVTYCDRVCAFVASELGIVIPDHDSAYWDAFEKEYGNIK